MSSLALLLAAGAWLPTAGPRCAHPTQEQEPAEASAVARWKGSSYSGTELVGAVGEPVATALQPWSPWARANGYVLELSPDLRSLFVHSAQRKASPQLALLARALASVDKLAPRPAGKDQAQALLVMLELEGPEDFGLLLDDLGKRFSYLASWAQGEKQQLGFVLERPLAAAFLGSAPELKEWNPKNELVNRAAQLALLERYGRLPHWLTQGLAWHVELSTCGSIFCFPFRSGFVAKKEHRGWSEQLKALRFHGPGPSGPDRPMRSPAIEDLTGWKRGSYENDRALLAWGAASFLAKRRAEALPQILEDLRAIREKESRITQPDGTWRLDPDYEVPPKTQQEILEARAGGDFFAELERFCRGN